MVNSAFNSDLFAEWVDVHDRNTAQISLGEPAAAELRSNTLAPDTYENTASLHFATNGTGFGPAVNIPGAAQLSADSFTIEFFMKMPAKTAAGTEDIVNTSFLKLCKLGTMNGRVLARCYVGGAYGGGTRDVNIYTTSNEWHHLAFVYDKAATTNNCRLYIDWANPDCRTETLYEGTASQYFFIGALGQGTSQNTQPYDGWMDEVRITRRALRPHEFLTPRPFMSNLAMDCVFADNLATGQDPVIAPAGTPSGTSSFANLRGGKVTLDGEIGKEKRDFGKSVVFDSGSVWWERNSILEQPNMTVEFWARIDYLPEDWCNIVTIRRPDIGQSSGNKKYLMNIQYRNNAPRLVGMLGLSADGNDVGLTESQDLFANGDPADGKWHHWAAVMSQTDTAMTLKLYRDWEQYGATITKTGKKLALPVPGSARLGLFASGGMKGAVSNLRVTPRVLEPPEFMHLLPSGLMIIFK